MEDKERELIFEVAGMAGDILLRSGAEISRVDETMRRIACAYELENVSTFVLSNGIILTSETEGSNHQVLVRHIPLAGARLDRIDAVNELSIAKNLTVKMGGSISASLNNNVFEIVVCFPKQKG